MNNNNRNHIIILIEIICPLNDIIPLNDINDII